MAFVVTVAPFVVAIAEADSVITPCETVPETAEVSKVEGLIDEIPGMEETPGMSEEAVIWRSMLFAGVGAWAANAVVDDRARAIRDFVERKCILTAIDTGRGRIV